MNRRTLVLGTSIGILTLLLGIVGTVGPDWYQNWQRTNAVKANLLRAVTAYIEDLQEKRLPIPPSVTIDDLIQGGFLSRQDVSGWDGKTKVPTVAHGIPPRVE